MAMRRILALLLVAAPAAADPFGGFSGVDQPYVVGTDRVCQPLDVVDGVAKGMPACEHAGADVIAQLSIKPPQAQRGAKAAFAATASDKVLTVANQAGTAVVTWTAPDPIGKVVEVYASQYEDRVAVAYTSRRLGREVTDVVAFVITKTTGRDHAVLTPPSATPGTGSGSSAGPPAAPVDPVLTKAIDKAKSAPKPKAVAAWQDVLALDADNSEAHYRIAALSKPADALGKLVALAASRRDDAVEWLIEARFDPAFASLRADPKFRAAVGLDRKSTTPYERLMGLGGHWEQTGTSCDKPDVWLDASRDRAVKVRIKSSCEGRVFDTARKGIWRVDGAGVVLNLARKGEKATARDEAPCAFEGHGDEDALRCKLDRDLEFVVLPTRR